MREPTHWGDGFLGEIDGGGTTVLLGTTSDSIDLLVYFGSVMVTVLTSAGDGPLNSTWMPSSNTSDLSKTLVSLSRKTSGSPTSGDTFETLTLGNTDGIDHLVLFEDRRKRNGFFKEANTECDFVGDGTAVDLNLHAMGLLLPQFQFTDLGMDQQADNGTPSTDAFEGSVNGLVLPLGIVVCCVFGESQLLGSGPILVKSSSDFIAQMLGPDSGQPTKALRGVVVTNNTDCDHGRGFQNCNRFHDLFLVEL